MQPDQEVQRIIAEAIADERRAQQRYALGASVASDTRLRSLFLQLLEEEVLREHRLRQWQAELPVE